MKWSTSALACAGVLVTLVLAASAFGQEPIRIAYIEGMSGHSPTRTIIS